MKTNTTKKTNMLALTGCQRHLKGGLTILAILASHAMGGHPEQPLNLGSADDFAILSKTGVSTVPASDITGDVGVSPIDSTAITGFSLIMDSSGEFSTSAQVTGKVYASDYTAPTPTKMTTAISDMETAFTNAAVRSLPDTTELGSGDISGLTIHPGLHKWSTGVAVNADVILDAEGDADAVFIFQIAGDLVVASGQHVILVGRAQARNIFWQVEGGAGAVIGTTAHVEGVLLTENSITLETGASFNGKLLAQTRVNLDQNRLVDSSLIAPPRMLARNDFDGDGITDMTVFHAAKGNWYILESTTGAMRKQNWGWSETFAVPGDYDGDGVTDIAVYYPDGGMWYILESQTGTMRKQNWGWSEAVPVPGDYDGDGKTDLAVYHAAKGDWYILESTTGTMRKQNWGWSETVPVPGDYDGDGKTDIAVYHPDGGMWYILESTTGGLRKQNWGWNETLPVPGDYDGDGVTDMAVYYPDDGMWYILESTTGVMRKQNWGWSETIPVPGDFDGDGIEEEAVYHAAEGNWYILESTTGAMRKQNWGWNEALPPWPETF
ncbi:MAG: ice-binding family protein [Kiritimatiellia bacterium]